MRKFLALVIASWMLSSPLVSQHIESRTDREAMAGIVREWGAQKALIVTLQAQLEQIRNDATAGGKEVEMLEAALTQLRQDNAKIAADLDHAQKINELQTAECNSALSAEKKKGFKKLLWGIAGGAAFGILLGAAVSK